MKVCVRHVSLSRDALEHSVSALHHCSRSTMSPCCNRSGRTLLGTPPAHLKSSLLIGLGGGLTPPQQQSAAAGGGVPTPQQQSARTHSPASSPPSPLHPRLVFERTLEAVVFVGGPAGETTDFGVDHKFSPLEHMLLTAAVCTEMPATPTGRALLLGGGGGHGFRCAGGVASSVRPLHSFFSLNNKVCEGPVSYAKTQPLSPVSHTLTVIVCEVLVPLST